MTEENEERDECERKKRIDVVGSEDCGEDDKLGRRGCESASLPCNEVWVFVGEAAVDKRPSFCGDMSLESIEWLILPLPPSPLWLVSLLVLSEGARTSTAVFGGEDKSFGIVGTGGGRALAV